MKIQKIIAYVLGISGLLILLPQISGADPLDNWHLRKNSETLNGIAYGNGIFVAVGDLSTILISPDGINFFTLVNGTPTYPWPPNLTAITYNNNLFVAVGKSGTIITSTDGITWTNRNSGISWDLHAVTYGNGLFVALGRQNIITSPDGINWTWRDTGTDYFLSGIAYGNGVFVAAGFSRWEGTYGSTDACCWTWDFPSTVCSKSIILASHDGISWTENSSLTTNCSLRGVTFGNGIFVAVGQSSILMSADGITWSDLKLGSNFSNIAYLNGMYLALDQSGDILFTSPDGTSWTSRDVGSGHSLYGIAYGNDIYVAVGEYSSIFTSPDAQNWTNRTLWIAQDAIYVNGTFVAVGGGGSILSSPDGIVWTRKDLGFSSALGGITYGNNIFVAVGEEDYGYPEGRRSTILTSTDGIDWETAPSISLGYSGGLGSVTYGNGTFVAVGTEGGLNFNGIVLTSSDGVNWTKITLDGFFWLVKVTYGNGMFVAVGGRNGDNGYGYVVTSTDGVNWMTRRVSGTTAGLGDVTYGNGIFVASGGEQRIILTSSDGINWTINSLMSYGAPYAIGYGNGTFIIATNTSIITSVDAMTWINRTKTFGNTYAIAYGNGTFVAVGYAVVQSDPVAASQYHFTLVKPGKGNGTVTSSPAGIACGPDCTEMYNMGSEVTLVATPSADSIFKSWSGACSGTDTTCTVTITNGPNLVTANFDKASESVSTPTIPDGVTNGMIDNSYSYSTGGALSTYGHPVQYRFDWGDGTNSEWLPVGTTTAPKSWALAGSYTVKVQARCVTDTSVFSDWSPGLSVTVSASEAVSAPTFLDGPSSATTGISYAYSTGGSSSNLGHSIEYLIDWGDGTDSGWLKEFIPPILPPPVIPVITEKSWSSAGTYPVKAQARCATDISVVSGWFGAITVTVTSPSRLSITPSAYDFGDVKVKSRNKASFSVKNLGTVNLIISSSISGGDASIFRIRSGGGSKTIKPGNALTINVAFRPKSAGSKQATLRITSNDPGAPIIDIPMNGRGM